MNDLFEKIIDKSNLYQAARRAALGKRFRGNIADWRFRMEYEVDRLYQELKEGVYRPGAYRKFEIHEPKKRVISVAPFRDRVVHHAFYDVIEADVDKRFIFDSYACRKGKGTHAAVARAQRFLRANKYCFHGDIRKYFPSIDHGILKSLLPRHLPDDRVLRVLGRIIDSTWSMADSDARRGLPIGNLTSQFFANLYLNELDRFAKHELQCRYYLRYMDDFLIFGNEKEDLKKIRREIGVFLRDSLKLTLNMTKSRSYPTGRGITFLGFRLFKGCCRLAGGNVRRMMRKVKYRPWENSGFVRRADNCLLWRKQHIALRCWFAHARCADSLRLRRAVLRKIL